MESCLRRPLSPVAQTQHTGMSSERQGWPSPYSWRVKRQSQQKPSFSEQTEQEAVPEWPRTLILFGDLGHLAISLTASDLLTSPFAGRDRRGRREDHERGKWWWICGWVIQWEVFKWYPQRTFVQKSSKNSHTYFHFMYLLKQWRMY